MYFSFHKILFIGQTGTKVQVHDPNMVKEVFGCFVGHFITQYRIKEKKYPPMKLGALDQNSWIYKRLINNNAFLVTKLTDYDVPQLSKIKFYQLFNPLEDLEFSDYADDKATAPDASKVFDIIINQRRLNEKDTGRLIIKLLQQQKGAILNIINANYVNYLTMHISLKNGRTKKSTTSQGLTD